VAQGAAGVQVGTPFAFCRESGILAAWRAAVLKAARQGEIEVLSDAKASPTGFPFKVVQLKGTLSEAAIYGSRGRSCDLGHLRIAYQRPDGGIGWRCPAERESAYLAKGGNAEDLVGRKCLCAGLAAAAGLGAEGEPCIITAGESVRHLADYLRAGEDSYSAADVINRILGGA
jgi:NAD(P)H-dependent flavin oxidoreductase YrpB (nitropropane dioxygenase family)